MDTSSTVDALLQAIRTIHDKVGNEEDGEDLQALERVIRSPEMKKAIEVSGSEWPDSLCESVFHQFSLKFLSRLWVVLPPLRL